VPYNLRVQQDKEVETVQRFWDNEINKCTYVRERRVEMKDEWNEI